jgi:hypothetical protein
MSLNNPKGRNQWTKKALIAAESEKVAGDATNSAIAEKSQTKRVNGKFAPGHSGNPQADFPVPAPRRQWPRSIFWRARSSS